MVVACGYYVSHQSFAINKSIFKVKPIWGGTTDAGVKSNTDSYLCKTGSLVLEGSQCWQK